MKMVVVVGLPFSENRITSILPTLIIISCVFWSFFENSEVVEVLLAGMAVYSPSWVWDPTCWAFKCWSFLFFFSLRFNRLFSSRWRPELPFSVATRARVKDILLWAFLFLHFKNYELYISTQIQMSKCTKTLNKLPYSGKLIKNSCKEQIITRHTMPLVVHAFLFCLKCFA